MQFYVGLDVSLKRTEICVVDASGRMLWRGVADTHPEMIAEKLGRWRDGLVRVGLETGSMTPWLARELAAEGLPVVVMDARRAADALKARPVKTDRADARALAEMLQTGWYTEVFVKSEESHRRRALLSAREQLVRMKRQIFGQVRGLLRPFGVRLPARAGTARFRDADYPGAAVQIGRMGLKRTGCILAAMLPLLCRARGSEDHPTRDDTFPAETRIGAVPSWVLDRHTRDGLAAFGRYRRCSERMRDFLAKHADPTANLNRLVGDLVFGMESGLLRRRLVWEEGSRLSRAAHLVQPGLPSEAISAAYAILREEIHLLNRCRTETAPDYLR